MRLFPAPCTFVETSLSTEDTIKKMADEDISYVLVKNVHDALAGIFTENDILNKFSILKNQSNLDRPISLFMSKNVKTLSIDLVQTAPEYLIKNKIRRAPIVKPNFSGFIDEIYGVITAGTVLESLVSNRRFPPDYKNAFGKIEKKVIGVLSPDGELSKTLSTLFDHSPTVNIQRLWFGKLQNEMALKSVAKTSDLIVIDIDGAPAKEWTNVVRSINSDPELENTFLLYTPEKHSDNTIKILDSLNSVGQFQVFQKPMDLSVFVLSIEDNLRQQAA